MTTESIYTLVGTGAGAFIVILTTIAYIIHDYNKWKKEKILSRLQQKSNRLYNLSKFIRENINSSVVKEDVFLQSIGSKWGQAID